jgi:carboxylesterase
MSESAIRDQARNCRRGHRDHETHAVSAGDSSVAGLPSTPGGAVLEHRRLVQALCAELGQIRQPALIIHPREDDYADLDNAWYLQRHLKGLVDMVVLDDSYHIVTVDRQRHLVVERTEAFVANVAKRIAAVSASASRPAVPARAAA